MTVSTPRTEPPSLRVGRPTPSGRRVDGRATTVAAAKVDAATVDAVTVQKTPSAAGVSRPTPAGRRAEGGSVWRSVLRSGGVRALVLPITAIIGILNTRLIIEHFGSAAYAQYGLLIGIGLLFPFADLGMSAAIINVVGKSSDPRRDPDVERVLITALRVLAGSASVLLLIVGTVSLVTNWGDLLGQGLLPGTGQLAAALCLALIAVTMPFGFGDRILTGLGKNHLTIIIQGLQAPIVLATLIFVVYLTPRFGPYVAAIPFFVTLCLALVSCTVAARKLGPIVPAAMRAAPHLRTVRGGRVFDVAWPMLIQMIALPIAMQTDRLVLSHVASSGALAQYNLASQMYTPVWQVVNAAGAVLWPVFARQRARGDNRVSPVPISGAFGGAAAAICLLITLVSPWLANLASGGRIHLPLLLILSFAVLMVFQALKYPLGMFMTDAPGLRYQALMIVLLLPVNLVLSIVLAHAIGPAGPVIGSAVGVLLCQVLANYVYVRRARAGRPIVVGSRRARVG